MLSRAEQIMVCGGCRVKFAAGLCARFATECGRMSLFDASRLERLQALKRPSVSDCDVAAHLAGQAEAATFKV
jgi:hypothetical protein